MGKNFQTNPLDPDFPRKAEEEQETSVLPEEVPETHPFFHSPATEEMTRTLVNDPINREDAFGRSNPETDVLPERHPGTKTPSRTIPGLLFSERTLTALVYFPYLGLILGAFVLFRTPRTESKLRFHSAQAMAAHIAILIIGTVVGILDFSNSDKLTELFDGVSKIILLVFVYKAWRNRPIHIEPIEPLTEWLESKMSRDVRWG